MATAYRSKLSRFRSRFSSRPSSKQAPYRSNLAHLPAEILEEIISYAILDDESACDRFDNEFLHSNRGSERELLRQLRLVGSGLIADVATDFLYQHVVVDCGATLGYLLRTMAEAPRLRLLIRSLLFTWTFDDEIERKKSFLGKWRSYGPALVSGAPNMPRSVLLDPVMLFKGLAPTPDVVSGQKVPWTEYDIEHGWGVDSIPAQMLILSLLLCATELRHLGIALPECPWSSSDDFSWLMPRLACVAGWRGNPSRESGQALTQALPNHATYGDGLLLRSIESITILYLRREESYRTTPLITLCSPLLQLPRLNTLRISGMGLLDPEQDFEGALLALKDNLVNLDIQTREPATLCTIDETSFANLRTLTLRFTASSYHELFETAESLTNLLPRLADSLESLTIYYTKLYEDLWYVRHHRKTALDGFDRYGRRGRLTNLRMLSKLKTLELPFAALFGFYPCAFRCELAPDSGIGATPAWSSLPRTLRTLVFQPESLKDFEEAQQYFDHRRLEKTWKKYLGPRGDQEGRTDCRCLAFQCLSALARRCTKDYQPELRSVVLDRATPGWRKLLEQDGHEDQLVRMFAANGVAFG